ncbi:hypothetical protein HYV88_04585 [Candidatus Woesearchaeota archaeon]|nr:hypothetical protein [Candidatus Woesearchaeota archaeon]
MKKGDFTTLQGLIGLVVGIAFAVLIIFVIVKFVGIFIPNSDKERGTPVTVFDEINKYEESVSNIIQFYLEPSVFLVGFDKESKGLDFSGMLLGVPRQKSPGGLSGGVAYSTIRSVNKPNVCDDKACICKCKIKQSQEKIDLDNIYLFCETNSLQCVTFNEIEKIEGKIYRDKDTIKRYNGLGIKTEDSEINPKHYFIMLNDPILTSTESFLLILRKEGKTIFIK